MLARLSAAKDRLSRGENKRKDAELRLADVNRTPNAGESAATAEKPVGAARQSAAAIEDKIASGTQAVAKWTALAASAFRHDEATRDVNIARARHSLPDDLRAELGIGTVREVSLVTLGADPTQWRACSARVRGAPRTWTLTVCWPRPREAAGIRP